MDWLPSGVTWGQVGVGLMENVFSSALLFVLGLFIGRRKRHRNVKFRVRRVDQMEERKRPHPKVILSTFTGYIKPKEMTEDEFRLALREPDLAKLPISESTQGVGQVAVLLRTYASSLQELILLTTKSTKGTSSSDSVELVRKWAQKMSTPPKISEQSVYLNQDDKVTNDSYQLTRDILEQLERENGLDPRDILVDVSGSMRTMNTGVLLACLRPDQDAHLIGAEYKDGTRGSSFPILIHFEPDLGR
jgi:hypothetical protein